MAKFKDYALGALLLVGVGTLMAYCPEFFFEIESVATPGSYADYRDQIEVKFREYRELLKESDPFFESFDNDRASDADKARAVALSIRSQALLEEMLDLIERLLDPALDYPRGPKERV